MLRGRLHTGGGNLSLTEFNELTEESEGGEEGIGFALVTFMAGCDKVTGIIGAALGFGQDVLQFEDSVVVERATTAIKTTELMFSEDLKAEREASFIAVASSGGATGNGAVGRSNCLKGVGAPAASANSWTLSGPRNLDFVARHIVFAAHKVTIFVAPVFDLVSAVSAVTSAGRNVFRLAHDERYEIQWGSASG